MDSLKQQILELGLPLVACKDPDTAPFRDKKDILKAMKKYCALDPLEHLYINGPALSGKTWVATRIALELLMTRDPEFHYVTLMDMVTAVLELKVPVNFYYNIEVLIIDNINTEKNAFSPSLLSRVVRHRLDYEKPMVLVSSLPDDAFKELYGLEMHQRISQLPCMILLPDEAILRKNRERVTSKMLEEYDA